MSPLISVVIPTIGKPEYLVQSIQSVIKQKLKVSEIIIVDGNEEKFLDEAIESFKFNNNIKIIKNINGNASENRNLGVKKSENDFIAFLDDDDIWLPNYLEESYNSLLKSKSSVVICWLNYMKGDSIFPFKNIKKDLKINNLFFYNPGIIGSNIFIKKEIFNQINGFDESLEISEDKDFLIKMIKEKINYEVLDKRLVIHRHHSNKQLSFNYKTRLRGTTAFFKKYYNEMNLKERIFSKITIDSLNSKIEKSFYKKIILYLKIITNRIIYHINFFQTIN